MILVREPSEVFCYIESCVTISFDPVSCFSFGLQSEILNVHLRYLVKLALVFFGVVLVWEPGVSAI
jgi:hypothetical protein